MDVCRNSFLSDRIKEQELFCVFKSSLTSSPSSSYLTCLCSLLQGSVFHQHKVTARSQVAIFGSSLLIPVNTWSPDQSTMYRFRPERACWSGRSLGAMTHRQDCMCNPVLSETVSGCYHTRSPNRRESVKVLMETILGQYVILMQQ